MTLSVADIERWDPEAVREVFHAATARAASASEASLALEGLPVFATWGGVAADSAHEAIGRTRVDLDAHANEATAVARAAERAAQDIEQVRTELRRLEDDAHTFRLVIDPAANRVVAGPGYRGTAADLANDVAPLQARLYAIIAEANGVDAELAVAINMADGAMAGEPAGRGEPRRESGAPPTLQDMLTGGGGPAEAAGADKAPGSLPWMLDRLQKPVPGAAPPTLTQQDIDEFKGLARQALLYDGVPAGQIEQRLNDMVARARQPLPPYVPPKPQAAPPPGFGEGFADRWFATEEGVKNLVGQGGPGAPGVLESWEGLLKGTVDQVANPVGAVADEVKNAMDSPSAAYYLGGKSADAAFAAPGLMFGGEGAAISRALGDIGPGVLEKGPVVSSHAAIGLDVPGSYTSWADEAAADLNHAFTQAGPTTGLANQLADLSTHYVGEAPDRVVLGRYVDQDAGYIGEARGTGGVYFDTGSPVWDAITHGLSETDSKALAWQVNEQFLRNQMESAVGRIDYLLDHDQWSSLEEMALGHPERFSAMEVNLLNRVAAEHGYRRVGDSWIYEGN
ncbi:hypothetical protein OG976_04840 [Mycobacterium sp. NBC_00419]|uniref:hypothetical protein n=1 Tax=Mycobacterium sp. NBC_00419 TaxID=2975989 RepID=UPI002E1A4182